ncbi:6192_t:CDS:2, partial [Dentiscutata heterogama]
PNSPKPTREALEEAIIGKKESNMIGFTMINVNHENDDCKPNRYEEWISDKDEDYQDVELSKWRVPDRELIIGNNWYDDAKEYEEFMIKVKNSNSEEETIKSELEDYLPAFGFFNNGVSGLVLLTSLFSDSRESTERRFVIEEYWKKLEY